MSNLKTSVVAISLLILGGCGGGNDGASSGGASGSTSSVQLQQSIVVVGDSIGTGTNATFAFPDLLESLTGLPVENISKRGSDAEFGAGRVADLIAEFRPRFLVLLLGTNNAGGAGGGVSGAVNSLQFAANVAEAAGVIAVIGTIPPISRDSAENARASEISAGIRAIANARIAPINRSISISDITDGKHPNDTGQRIIATLFAEQIF